MLPDQPVNVTYTSTPTSLRHLPYILSSLNSQLPLRNFHWKSATKPSVRTVQECDVKFHKLVDFQTKTREWNLPKDVEAGSLIEGGLVHICFVECEDNEAYKSSVKPYISSWITSLPAPQQSHAQNLIVLVNTASTNHASQTGDQGKSPGGMFTNLRSAATGSTAASILSKLKADFGATGVSIEKANTSSTNLANILTAPVTRVVSLPLPSQPSAMQNATVTDPSLFLDLTQALKESIIGALDEIVREREDTVRKGETSMRIPGGGGGWTWTKFFSYKESLAKTYERIGLWEDALLTYDELEASMVQVARDSSAFIGRTGTEKIASLAIPLFPSRDASSSNLYPGPSSNFTIYDYQIYLFRRQIEMLLNSIEMGMKTQGGKSVGVQIVERGLRWVLFMGRWLRENSPSNLTDVIEAFLYDSVVAIEQICRQTGERLYNPAIPGKDPLIEPERKIFFAGRGDLLDIAIIQMDRIGLKYGILPQSYPFLQSSQLLPQKDSILFDVPVSPIIPDHPPNQTKETSSTPSSRELTSLAQTPEEFFSTYQAHVEAAKRIEQGSGRTRFRMGLDERIAELAYHRGNLEAARKAYVGLCQDYLSDEGRQPASGGATWHSIRMRALARAVECHDRLGRKADKLSVMLGLEYLSLLPTGEDTGGQDQIAAMTTDTAGRVVESMGRFNDLPADQDIEIYDHPIFQVALASSSAKLLETEDGSTIRIRVTCNAPTSLDIDDVRACLVGPGQTTLWFSSGDQTLTQGINEIDLTTFMPAAGIFTLSTTKIVKGRIVFEQPCDPQSENLSKRVVRIPRDMAAIEAALSIPQKVSLEDEPRLDLILQSGRNNIVELNIVLQSMAGDMTFFYQGTHATEGQDVRLDAHGITINDIAELSRAVLSIPYASEARSDEAAVVVTVEYRTAERAEVKRYYQLTQTLNLSLPLAVNVQDFFRPDCLISKFTVSAGSHGPIRTRSAVITTEQAGIKVEPFSDIERPMNITASTPIPYIFRITRTDAVPEDYTVGRLLRLTVSYQLDSDETDFWRTLIIPVEIPPMQIISQSSVMFPATSQVFRLGESISVRLRIETSNAWAQRSIVEPVAMMYDIIADKEGWLVAGPKRGSYIADPQNPFEIDMALIPMRHGLLAYPSIVTQPMPYEIGATPSNQGVPSFENYQEDGAGAVQVVPDTVEDNGVIHVLRELGRVRDSWGSEHGAGIVT